MHEPAETPSEFYNIQELQKFLAAFRQHVTKPLSDYAATHQFSPLYHLVYRIQDSGKTIDDLHDAFEQNVTSYEAADDQVVSLGKNQIRLLAGMHGVFLQVNREAANTHATLPVNLTFEQPADVLHSGAKALTNHWPDVRDITRRSEKQFESFMSALGGSGSSRKTEFAHKTVANDLHTLGKAIGQVHFATLRGIDERQYVIERLLSDEMQLAISRHHKEPSWLVVDRSRNSFTPSAIGVLKAGFEMLTFLSEKGILDEKERKIPGKVGALFMAMALLNGEHYADIEGRDASVSIALRHAETALKQKHR